MYQWDPKKMGIKVHQAATIVPMMPDEKFEAFKQSISIEQLEPCIIYRGKLLDGRNRWRACVELGKKPFVERWPDNDPNVNWNKFDPWQYVLSQNIHRRDLTRSQAALSAVVYAKYHDEKSTVEKLAHMFGVSDRYVTAARNLHSACQENRRNNKAWRKIYAGEASLTDFPKLTRLGRIKDPKPPKDKPPVSTNRIIEAWNRFVGGREEFLAFLPTTDEYREWKGEEDRPSAGEVTAAVEALGGAFAVDAEFLSREFLRTMAETDWTIGTARRPVRDWRRYLCTWLKTRDKAKIGA